MKRDISEDRRPASEDSGGGDFHTAFWSDAKLHARGEGDLPALTTGRIMANSRKRRLYPLLTEGFLDWWNERRRWINEPFQVLSRSVKARHVIEQFGCTVKIENLFSVQMADGSFRLIYPYFSEHPELREEAARIGHWVMGQALPNYDPRGFRILDVLRAHSFRAEEHPPRGNEEAVFLRRYAELLKERRALEDG
ncbi:hypothetical protein GTW25_10800 [Aliihoeflea aestuarii]|uniref:hypothetical protein n=1 Tax=Aliihoeflea aestuarii TaxID=453840 RepID=UPI002092B7CA|nr:hypothetical protein [Aliihoeflea aestuarii]MCO6391518.1 hypothetical protein [Aliihoeflea aestuarii]